MVSQVPLVQCKMLENIMNYLCSDFTLNLQWCVANSKNGKDVSLETHGPLSPIQKISSNSTCNVLTDRTLGFVEISLLTK